MDLGWILATIVGAVLAFIWGTLKGKRADETKQLKRNAEAHERAKGVTDEVGSLSDADLDERLRKRARK